MYVEMRQNRRLLKVVLKSKIFINSYYFIYSIIYKFFKRYFMGKEVLLNDVNSQLAITNESADISFSMKIIQDSLNTNDQQKQTIRNQASDNVVVSQIQDINTGDANATKQDNKKNK